ncbi:unnamed protein product [Acanthoscelides obtectus]|uniref:Uncharacterized protein n=1 Tax=Acanthoscelides obtectus TaxID=200917 RepID=A0A9P0LFZ5_ACAOB|nr:unnamed protein product [Acanthoscelides obtectus]CAK1644115.1 hypothetical protein AOBTE_LOCUS13836 [Acanthoscelides obtectus]
MAKIRWAMCSTSDSRSHSYHDVDLRNKYRRTGRGVSDDIFGDIHDIKIHEYLEGVRPPFDIGVEPVEEPQGDVKKVAREETEDEQKAFRNENDEQNEGDKSEQAGEGRKEDEVPGEGGFEELVPYDVEYVAPEEEGVLGDEGSVETVFEEPRKIEPERSLFEDQRALFEDLERFKVLQEIPGETDEEVEKYKCALIEDMPLTESQLKAVGHFGPGITDIEPIKEGAAPDEDVGEEEEEFVGESEEEDKDTHYEEVWVDAIPGIGPVVPEHLVRAVGEYMSSIAAIQHGMVMPRNIRHYNCPPLEVVEY